MTSSEIIEIRNKYGLSQSKLAKLIKCGEKNIARYEKGAIQDASIDLLIRMVDLLPNYFGLVEKAEINRSIQTEYNTDGFDVIYDQTDKNGRRIGGRSLCPQLI